MLLIVLNGIETVINLCRAERGELLIVLNGIETMKFLGGIVTDFIF